MTAVAWRPGLFNLPSNVTLLEQINSQPEKSLLEFGLYTVNTIIPFVSQYGSKLRTLNLTGITVTTESTVEILNQCPNIEFLKIGGNCLEDEAFITLAGFTNLQTLDLSHSTIITDETLDRLLLQRHLRELKLHQCCRITEVGLEALSNIAHQLTLLDLSHCKASDESLASVINRASQLSTINISDCKHITDVTLTNLADCATKLKRLEIAWSQIADKGLLALEKNAHNLEFLDFTGCKGISEKGIRALVDKTKNLAVLDLSCCTYSIEFFKELRALYPNLEIRTEFLI